MEKKSLVPRRIPCAHALASSLVIVVGILVLAGWVLDIGILRSLNLSPTTMKPNTALAFVLSGVALALLDDALEWRHPLRRIVGGACAGVATLIGLMSLSQDLFQWNAGIDEMFFRDNETRASGGSPGRMALTTAICIVLNGAVLLQIFSNRKWGRLLEALCAASLLISLVAIAGHLYGVSSLYHIGPYTTMAFHTALTFSVLSTGILLAHPRSRLRRLLSSSGPGGVLLRNLLPAVVLVPLILGWFRLQGQLAGWYDTQFGLALFAISNVVIFTVLILAGARRLDSADFARRSAEEASKWSERLYRRLVDSNLIGVVVADFEGRIHEANDAFLAMVGRTQQDLQSGRLTWMMLTPSEYHILDEHALDELRTNGVATSYEMAFQAKGGLVVPVQVGAAMVDDTRGIFIRYVLDLTEPKRAEQALLTSRERYENLYHSQPDMMFTVDAESGQFLYCNRTFLDTIGYSIADLNSMGKAVMQRLHPDCLEVVDAACQRLKLSGEMNEVEATLRRGDGQTIDIVIRGTSTRDAMGKVVQCHTVLRDVTDRKRMDELQRRSEEVQSEYRRIEAANRLKSEFLANMSHELRTPLNSIIGFAELMHDGKVGPISEEHQEYLGDILVSSRHLLGLINDVLDLAKVESGTLELHPENVSPEVIAAEVRDVMRPLIARKRLRFTLEVADELPSVVTDPSRLKQIIYNYLSNAVKFTPDEGWVVLRIAPADADSFRVEVEDSGVGIRHEDLGRLFLEFQQLDATKSKRYQGTGLGLALTRRLVEAMGGTVGVRSVPGQGSLFFAVLPKGLPGRVQSKELVSGLELPTLPTTGTILVIEDEPTEQAWLEQNLTAEGYRVTCASTGQEAIAIGRTMPFSAISLDLLLPDMSGWDVLRALRGAGPNRTTPAIVVSVVETPKVARGIRVADTLVKPLQARELVTSLQRAGVFPGVHGPIVLVDDDPAVLEAAGAALRFEGFECLCYADGRSALEAVERVHPSVLVLDLLMPGMDGYQFLEQFRRLEAGQRTPVIVYTGRDLSEEDRARLRSTAQAVLVKTTGGISPLVDLLRECAIRPPINVQSGG